MSHIKENELDGFTAEFFKLTPDQQSDALKNLMVERNAMTADLEQKTQLIAANEGNINNLPVVTFKGKRYQFTREKFNRKADNATVAEEITAEAAAKNEKFIKWAVENGSGILKEVG